MDNVGSGQLQRAMTLGNQQNIVTGTMAQRLKT
jgi:hypothetical protein